MPSWDLVPSAVLGNFKRPGVVPLPQTKGGGRGDGSSGPCLTFSPEKISAPVPGVPLLGP